MLARKQISQVYRNVSKQFNRERNEGKETNISYRKILNDLCR